MKKILFLGAMAAMLLGTASCSNDMEPAIGDGTVQFKVELPGGFDSRAIADGTTATKLEVACYDADGKKLAVEPTVKTDFVNREATVTYKLVKGQKYNFAFFAHADGAPYTFSAGTKLDECKFDVDYNGACNAENRDAFYAVLENYEVSATTTDVTLYRPFAQLNFGADDLEAAAAAGIVPSQSKVKVSKAATTFNLKSGESTGEAAVEYTLADLPDDPATLTVEGNTYSWMEMCYFLVPGNEANVDVEMTVNTNKQPVVVPVTSVPVKKNHRTNIVGSLFTEDANFNVIIDQDFDTPDNNINFPEVTDVVYWNNQKFETIEAAYNAALAANQNDIVISLAKGTYTIDNNFAFENQGKVTNVTVQAANGVNAADITINGRFAMSASSAQKVATGSSMTIKGLTLTTTTTATTKNDDTHYYRSGSEKSSIYIFGGVKLTVEDCIFNIADSDGKATGVVTWGDQATTAVVKNCTFNCEGNSKPLQIGNGSSNTIDGCTFNQPKKYAVQVNHYSPSDPISQFIFKNNIINANPSAKNYGIALDARQEAYYNLNVTVANNVMNDAISGSYLYAHSNNPAIWETVTVNNSRDEWGIYPQ
jgi:hypothetical protein